MTPAEAVDRARSACGHGCNYQLGAGGMKPESPWPWQDKAGVKACDCSGFAMWALGLSRFQPPLWYDTSRIVHDAKHACELFEALGSWDEARPGDLLVWGDRNGSQGHVGMVVSTGPIAVVHCSRGNWVRSPEGHRDAIRETGPEVFEKNGAIAVRCKRLQREALA